MAPAQAQAHSQAQEQLPQPPPSPAPDSGPGSPLVKYRRRGPGRVPAISVVSAAVQHLCEIPSAELFATDGSTPVPLDFSPQGEEPARLREFLRWALEQSTKLEPNIESGNKYGVSDNFHAMNGALLVQQAERSAWYGALQPQQQERALEFMKIVLMDDRLRSRNPLHPSVVDAWVFGNLMNFPKHIFGFPFASYSTNGAESLSLVLYSHRLRFEAKAHPHNPGPRTQAPVVLCITHGDDSGDDGGDDGGGAGASEDVRLCAARLGMTVVTATAAECASGGLALGWVACAMVDIEDPSLGQAAAWCEAHGIPVHVHVADRQWRSIFSGNVEPVHFDLPQGIRSMSIEEGLLSCGYQLYRDSGLRDLHFDVGYAWQTAYMSPNEGGSGVAAPLYIDFCIVLLGWDAMRDIARGLELAQPGAMRPRHEQATRRLVPTLVEPERVHGLPRVEQGEGAFAALEAWAEGAMADEAVTRETLERYIVAFQRNFLGGKDRTLEALTTGGGTRSINLALESILARARAAAGAGAANGARPRVITGNPHLAVERAERRFQFDLTRVDVEGALCPNRLDAEIRDPSVIAVYSQTLSYTDGTSDDLAAILDVVEAENQRRLASHGAEAGLVTLVNDCCLAFCVLVHNDGRDGSKSMRLLDMSQGLATPVIVTLDAHKHLGTDKGVSTVVGTPSTLSHLRGAVKVGSQPSKGELVRALADMMLVGVDGYTSKYRSINAELEKARDLIVATGLTIVHAANRHPGSSVIAVEDPSSVISRKLKKLGHSSAALFNLHPSEPNRCQTGWSISFTPYCLREVRPDGRTALGIYLEDLVKVHSEVQAKPPTGLAAMVKENSFMAFNLRGGRPECYLFSLLRAPGFGRTAGEIVLRGIFSQLLDGGVVRSGRRRDPLKQAAMRGLALVGSLVGATALGGILWSVGRRRAALGKQWRWRGLLALGCILASVRRMYCTKQSRTLQDFAPLLLGTAAAQLPLEPPRERKQAFGC